MIPAISQGHQPDLQNVEWKLGMEENRSQLLVDPQVPTTKVFAVRPLFLNSQAALFRCS